MAKAHNHANFIAFGGRIEYRDSIEEMLETYMNTKEEKERHERRVNKIMKLEN